MNSVTVIIPVLNAAVCLTRCLESVFGQKRSPDQVIVVNDGSTDNTGRIANDYRGRIQYFEHENKGPAASRNVGLKIARGEYVAFLDADDYWQPEFLQKCVQFLETHPEAVAVSTGQTHKLWGHGRVIRPPLMEGKGRPEAPFLIDNFFSFWADQNHVVTGSCLIRRGIIAKAGYQRSDFRMCEDLEYWGYLATFGKWGFIPEILWVGDPTPAAAAQGWMKKHQRRWRNLPTIEQWQSRIMPRLLPEDMEGFQRVRNRVAASLVHQNILAGNDGEAKRILEQFGDTLPKNQIIRLLQGGNKGGAAGWSLACRIIRLRERLKSGAIAFSLSRFRENRLAHSDVS